jgi:hypothetical protein
MWDVHLFEVRRVHCTHGAIYIYIMVPTCSRNVPSFWRSTERSCCRRQARPAPATHGLMDRVELHACGSNVQDRRGCTRMLSRSLSSEAAAPNPIQGGTGTDAAADNNNNACPAVVPAGPDCPCVQLPDGSAARTRLHATAVSIGVVPAASLCTWMLASYHHLCN